MTVAKGGKSRRSYVDSSSAAPCTIPAVVFEEATS